MVIQRWQTVFLLLAVVMMAVFCFSPVAVFKVGDTVSHFHPSDAPVFLVVNILIAALLFIAIFLYKNLRRQMTVTLVSIVLIAVSMVTGGFVLYAGQPDAIVEFAGADILLLGAMIMAMFAYRNMRKDHRKLSSYDRIR